MAYTGCTDKQANWIRSACVICCAVLFILRGVIYSGQGMAKSPFGIRIRRPFESEIALGPGKADLLEAIYETGSISAAARSMNMSYKRAWDLVNVMNTRFEQLLVDTATGGKKGGGAQVTEFGQEVLGIYRRLESKALEAVAQDLEELNSRLKPNYEQGD
ncbi:MAG: LysR family transcriptional regulator [Limnobacter sp.]|nr:LysR family transcriptional regulator [Limnobacter sp.]